MARAGGAKPAALTTAAMAMDVAMPVTNDLSLRSMFVELPQVLREETSSAVGVRREVYHPPR